MQLTLTQLTALTAVQEEVRRGQQKFTAILRECGLDPAVPYQIQPDGTVVDPRPDPAETPA